MPEQSMRQDRDLVLPPGTYAFVLDTTKGSVNVYVGPRSGTLSPTDRLVIWSGKKFIQNNDFSQAIQSFIKAGEGQYIVLTDPASSDDESFPVVETITPATQLDVGKRIVIPGPRTFPLWPGQAAQVIDGHHLNLNNYVIAQVYEPEAARANMERQIATPQAGEGEGEGTTPTARRNFTMGERIVIRGTDVSFYVPPTGIEVLPEERNKSFVREAATLEQLEYAVLVDENGRKRYERGPAVIFPEPTEAFVMEKGSRKFRAIELNQQSGLYLKVVADYVHDGDESVRAWRGGRLVEVPRGGTVEEGDELFITGEDTPIYFPRPEQSVIHYGEQRKHHAVAVPVGEGRYVLDRTTGEVELVNGPRMFLPDPRTQVVVRRVLDGNAVAMMYPGNNEAAQVNAEWRNERAATAEEFLPAATASLGEAGSLARSYQASSTFAGERMRRGTEYTPPRTITLDTKYQGAVGINVWPGYAVLVMDKTGERRVEVGSKPLLLKYDESLMALTLSTGRPKTNANPLRTVYLRTVNNAVSDRITVETKDLVPVRLDLSLRVNFEGDDPLKWFDVEDYVQLLTDHVRSKLRNIAKRHEIQEFYTGTIDIIRDALLGPSEDGTRTGLPFPENGMLLYDVEVLNVEIEHADVATLLGGAMSRALQGAIRLSEAEQEMERDARLQEIARQTLHEREVTAEAESAAEVARIQRNLEEGVARIATEMREAEETMRLAAIEREDSKLAEDQARELLEARNAVDLSRMRTEVELYVQRVNAIDGPMVAALQSFGDQAFVERLVEAVGPAAIAAGITTSDFLHQLFVGTPFEGITETLTQRPLARHNGGRAATEIEATPQRES